MQTAEELELVIEELRDCEMQMEALAKQWVYLKKRKAHLDSRIREENYRAYGEQDDVPKENWHAGNLAKGSNLRSLRSVESWSRSEGWQG